MSPNIGYYCILIFLAFLSLTSAVPTPAELAPRDCRKQPLINVSKLNKAAPDEYFNGPQFTLNRTGGPNSNTIKSVVSFSYIPVDATGCMLEIDLPKLPMNYWQTETIAGGASQADVWLIKQPAGYTPGQNYYVYEWSWNKPPVKDQFVSTVIFPTTNPTDGPYKTYLWSGKCSPTMSFQFELSDWQQGAGWVNFYSTPGGKLTLVPIGFNMVYNC